MSARVLRGLAGGLVVVAFIGFVDYITGPEFGFAFFYFIPIIPVAWQYGRRPGLIVAVAAAVMWFLADAPARSSQSFAPVAWNGTSRLAIFLAGAYLIDRVRQDRQSMRAIDEQRDDFLQILEHELPVPAEQMIDALTKAQARGSLEPRDIETLRHQAESLLFLTRDFVALGEAQARRLRLRAVPVDLVRIITEISQQREEHGSILVTLPGESLIVHGDPDRLRQAITNTVADVRADAGGIDYVSVNARVRGSDAIVTISAAMTASATRTGEATGVSLRLARLLIEAMGGSVVIERAALGKGTRVTMRMPIATVAPELASPAEGSPRP